VTTWQPWIHFGHVLAAVVWVGGGVVLSVVGLRARRSGSLAVVDEFGRTLSYVGLRVFMPALVVVLASGLWLALVGSEWRITQPWLLLSLGMFALAFAIGALHLSRSAIAVERAARDGDVAAASQAIGRWLAGYAVVLLVLVVAVWDMVVKPGPK
jgi:uncharacterized membrane protein